MRQTGGSPQNIVAERPSPDATTKLSRTRILPHRMCAAKSSPLSVNITTRVNNYWYSNIYDPRSWRPSGIFQKRRANKKRLKCYKTRLKSASEYSGVPSEYLHRLLVSRPTWLTTAVVVIVSATGSSTAFDNRDRSRNSFPRVPVFGDVYNVQ